ncbi:hypothetical protein E2562_025909 [Oryza meyeriana var. granulata]|uniref:Alpha/beta hydrolase fold-3 domain-containing protein n=1 Tax=Oryza meyeriana var. granulata TaxID=110450 RepID=A0A6G1CII9_9ORYZ|nr:hypothetical protein E2562_025909 [Oryza meyeriana var. granulata]
MSDSPTPLAFQLPAVVLFADYRLLALEHPLLAAVEDADTLYVAPGAAGGVTRDHPAANPLWPDSSALGPVELPPLLVAAGDRDMLIDRVREYVARLEATGNKRAEFAGVGHGFAIVQPDGEAAGELVHAV